MHPQDEKYAARLKALTREIREEMGDNNVLDALVRELAISRLALTDLGQQVSEITRELTALKTVQRARDILLPQARTQYAGRRQAQFDASLPMPATRGFHGLERDGSGNPFRWTGPTPNFHFDFHLDRSGPVKFALQLASWGAEQARNLRCFCDDIEVPLVRRTPSRTLELEGLLLPRETLGVTRISFIVETLSSAPAQGGESAVRQIGVPFLKLVAAVIADDEADEWLKRLTPPPAASASAAPAKPALASAPVPQAGGVPPKPALAAAPAAGASSTSPTASAGAPVAPSNVANASAANKPAPASTK